MLNYKTPSSKDRIRNKVRENMPQISSPAINKLQHNQGFTYTSELGRRCSVRWQRNLRGPIANFKFESSQSNPIKHTKLNTQQNWFSRLRGVQWHTHAEKLFSLVFMTLYIIIFYYSKDFVTYYSKTAQYKAMRSAARVGHETSDLDTLYCTVARKQYWTVLVVIIAACSLACLASHGVKNYCFHS